MSKIIIPLSYQEFHTELDPGLESFSIRAMSDYLVAFTAKFKDIIIKEFIPKIIPKTEFEQALSILNKVGKANLGDYTVYTPEYLDGALVPFLKVLTEVITELKDIEKKLLHPLDIWASNMIDDPDYRNKLWPVVLQKDNSVEKNTEKLHQFFNEASHDQAIAKLFEDVYVSSGGFKEADALIRNLSDIATDLIGDRLSDKAKSVSEKIKRIADNQGIASSLEYIPDTKITPVVQVVSQAAKEMELLAVVLFQVNTVSWAHQQNIKKIIDQLGRK